MKKILLSALIATTGLGPLPAQAGIWENFSENWLVKTVLGKITDYPYATATVASGMAYPYYNYNLSLLDPFGRSLLGDCRSGCSYRANFETQSYSTVRTASLGYLGSLALAVPLEALGYYCDPGSISLSSVASKLATSALPIFLGSGLLNSFIPEKYHMHTAWATMCIPHMSQLYANYVRSNTREQIKSSANADEIKQAIKKYNFKLTDPELGLIKAKFKQNTKEYRCFDLLQQCAKGLVFTNNQRINDPPLISVIKDVCINDIAKLNLWGLGDTCQKKLNIAEEECILYQVRQNKNLLQQIATSCGSYAVLTKLNTL